MEHAGALYYERGVRYFEIGEYELAVMDWIRAYESGYEQELTVKNLYQCFITPNEEEFRKNFEQNSEGLTELSYDACELDFIPVSEEKFYIYNRASGVFHGSIQLEQHPVHGKNEAFSNILYTDIWDIREILPDLQEYNRNIVYLLFEHMEPAFISFFKLPRFRELYLSNILYFRNDQIMQTFFEEYEEFYLPKQLVTSDAEKYLKILHKIHENRVRHVHAQRNHIFLSVCILEKADHAALEQLRGYLKQCPYDSELEVLLAGSRDEEDEQDARIRYIACEEQECYVLRVQKALHLAKGSHKVVARIQDQAVFQQMGRHLDQMKSQEKQTVFSIKGDDLGNTSEIFTNLERLEYLVPKMIHEKQDLFVCLELRNQYVSQKFHSGSRMDQLQNWKQALFFIEGMQQLLDMKYTKIPVQERDHGLVVIATTQLLGQKHAPTRILLELSRAMEVYLKKEVFLLSELKECDEQPYIDAGIYNVYKYRFLEELNGSFTYPYKECCFSGYQISLKQENKAEMKQLMKQLYDRKPYAVWCIGGMPAFAGAMRQFTSMVYMECSEGYPGIPTDIAVNYFDRSPILWPQEKEFLTAHGVKVRDIRIGLPSYQKSKGIYDRSHVNIPQDAFCIGISGNRLESDCTDEFLDALRKTVQKKASKEIWLVFIGLASDEFIWKVITQTGAAPCVRFLGFCKEFADVIALVDLVAATPGLGNGGTGVTALQEGIPVVSLEAGDIASCVGKDFQCSSLNEYPALIHRYIKDADFYQSQSQKAKNIFQSLLVDEETVARQVQEVLEQVTELADTGKDDQEPTEHLWAVKSGTNTQEKGLM